MADKILIKHHNHAYVKILCEPNIAQELSEYFKFRVPGYQFNPKFKAKIWDGYIYLFSVYNRLLYKGLSSYVESFAKDREYEIEYDGDFSKNRFDEEDADKFIKTMGIPSQYEIRDYQTDTFVHCIKNKRHLFISPTGSGKSLMIYLITRYINKKTLIIVPKTQLVDQLTSDFEDYGYDIESNVHKIYSGKEKHSDKPVIISTWQSIYRMPKTWFDQFEVVFGDEAHKCKAKELTTILSNMKNAEYRYGFTGSLDESKTHKLVLEGLFGQYKKIVSTKELIDRQYLADLNIKSFVLDYSDDHKKLLSKSTYQEELDWILKHEGRNNFIKNLTLSINKNVLILFLRIEHGIKLYELIKKSTNRAVYLIHGEVKVEDREIIRKAINKDTTSITIASIGTFAEGINIPNIDETIIASPTKSKIWVLQMIGRGLRVSDRKQKSILHDIADNLIWKKYKNHTIRHYAERIRYYAEEKFPVTQYRLAIE